MARWQRGRRMRLGGIAAAAVVALAGTLLAEPARAADPVNNACLYSYDGYWRSIPMTIDGAPRTVAGNQLIDGTTLQRGDEIHLTGATISAQLPGWLAEQAYNLGILGPGTNTLNIAGEVALEATNTEEGAVRSGFTGTASVTIIETPPGEADIVGPLIVDQLELDAVEWTAAGGRVAVRQAAGHALDALPTPSTVHPPEIFGSLYVDVSLPAAPDFTFNFQCLPGTFLTGDSHTAAIAAPIATAQVPAFTDAGGALPGPLQADVIQTGRLFEPWPQLAEPGDVRSLNSQLEMVLSAGQASEVADQLELGAGDHTVQIGGEVALAGDNASPASTAVTIPPVDVQFTVAGDGSVASAVSVTAPLQSSTWTMGDVRNEPGHVGLGGQTPVALSFSGNGRQLDVTLQRYSSPLSAPTPVASIYPTFHSDVNWGPWVPPVEQPPPPVSPPSVAPPSAPPPVVQPPAVVRTPRVPAGRLTAARNGQVAVRVRCTGNAICRGTVRLASASKIRVGTARARVVAFGQRAYTVRPGRTAVVRVTIPRAARKAFTRVRPRVPVRVTLQPRRGEGRAVNVRRVLTGTALVTPVRGR